jgi:hypothetical protein
MNRNVGERAVLNIARQGLCCSPGSRDLRVWRISTAHAASALDLWTQLQVARVSDSGQASHIELSYMAMQGGVCWTVHTKYMRYGVAPADSSANSAAISPAEFLVGFDCSEYGVTAYSRDGVMNLSALRNRHLSFSIVV